MGYLDDAINKARQGKAPAERPKGNTHAHVSLSASVPESPEAKAPAELPKDSAPLDSGALPVAATPAPNDASTMASAIAWLTQPSSDTDETKASDVAALSPQELAMQLAPAGSSSDPIRVVEELAQSLPPVQPPPAVPVETPSAVLPDVPPQAPAVPPAVSLANLVDSAAASAAVQPEPVVPVKTSAKKSSRSSHKHKTLDQPSTSETTELLPQSADSTTAQTVTGASQAIQTHEPTPAHQAQSVLGQAPGLPTRPAESDVKARDERLVILDDPASVMAEEYRSIRTSLLARWQNKRHLVHTITSATPQEGKTITSLNLGLCLAELRNRRTIVVEVDLRLPQYDRLLALKPGPGLVGYLEGKADLNQIIQQLPDSALHVIAAGGNAGNTAVQLVSSPQMADLIKTLREHYDHVIIDTPPVVELADAGILGAMSDDVLLIVRMQMTPKPLVEQAIRTLASYNAPVGGLIATDQHHHRGGYYYKYGYRYGYGRYYHYHSKKKPHRD